MMRRLVILCCCLLALGVLLTGGQSAKAATHATAPKGLFDLKTYPTYVVHGIPGVPVDVYVNGALAIPNFQPGTTAGPFNLPNGYITVALYPVGANPATTAPIVKNPVGISSTLAPVSVVAQLDYRGQPSIRAYPELLDFVDVPGYGMIQGRDATGENSHYNFCYRPDGVPFNLTVAGQYVKAGHYTALVSGFGDAQCNNPIATTDVTIQEEITSTIYLVKSPIDGSLSVFVSNIPDQGDR